MLLFQEQLQLALPSALLLISLFQNMQAVVQF